MFWIGIWINALIPAIACVLINIFAILELMNKPKIWLTYLAGAFDLISNIVLIVSGVVLI